MPNANSKLAYHDVKELLDKALSSEKGLDLSFQSDKAAIRWLSRANSFRALDRKSNQKLYAETHDLHQASVYDTLSLARDKSSVLIRPRTNEGITVIEL